MLTRRHEQRIKDYVNWIFVNQGLPWPGNRTLTHRFRLRPDFKVMVDLPCDLSSQEARRLGDAITTFCFGN